MTAADRMDRLAEALQAAVSATLDELGPGLAEVPPPAVLVSGDDALDGVEIPSVVAHAVPADGVTGPLLVTLTVAGTRRLAAVVGAIDEEEAEFGGDSLGDRELGALREVTTQLTTAVSAAVTGVVDRDTAFRPASVRVAEGAADVRVPVDAGANAVAVAFTLLGEPGRLVLLVPSGIGSEPRPSAAAAAAATEQGDTPLSDALRSVNVRVWAELGRTRMPTGQVVALPSGEIVELDRDAEDAVDLYVDGQRYATGRLVVTDDDSWGVRIEHILAAR